MAFKSLMVSPDGEGIVNVDEELIAEVRELAKELAG